MTFEQYILGGMFVGLSVPTIFFTVKKGNKYRLKRRVRPIRIFSLTTGEEKNPRRVTFLERHGLQAPKWLSDYFKR
jgi:hypothetical protein